MNLASRVKIFTLFRIPVSVHISAIAIPILIFIMYANRGILAVLFGLALNAALLLSVVIHEYGHALMARRYGIESKEITIHALGGAAIFDTFGSNYQELMISAAGPATSLILGIVSAGIAWLTSSQIIALFAFLNIFIVALNLIPALPLDGGRILRSSLALKYGKLRATLVSARIARVLAIVMGVTGIYFHLYGLALIAIFIWFLSRAELAAAQGQK